MTVHPLRGAGPYVAVLCISVASNLLARWYGIFFDDSSLTFFWQYLDAEILRHDLLRGIWLLHSQPPLFNLFLGCVLKLFPDSSTFAFAVLLQAMGVGILFTIVWLMQRLQVPYAIALLLCALLAFHPSFLVYTHWLFYTVPVALTLVLSVASLLRFAETSSGLWARVFCWLAAILMLTRAIFHPVWFVVVIATTVLLVGPVARRRLLVAAVAPLLVVNLWYAKNAVQVGIFGASSWLGMNLRRGWSISSENPPGAPEEVGRKLGVANLQPKEIGALVDAGKVPEVWLKRPFAKPPRFRSLGYFAPYEAGDPGCHPAICAPYKSDGRVNYNHRDYALISREFLRGDLAVMRAYPDRYLQRVAMAFWYFLQPGPRLIFGAYNLKRLEQVCARWNGALFLSGFLGAPAEDSFNLIFIAYPALLLYGTTKAWFTRGPARAVFAYVALTLTWFILVTNLIEIGENDRMRFEIDPLMLVLLGCMLASLERVVATSCRTIGRRRSRLAAARSPCKTGLDRPVKWP